MSKHNTQPWLRTVKGQKSKVWVYTTAEGKQRSLGYKENDKELAFKKWHSIMAEAGVISKSETANLMTLLITFLAMKLKNITKKYHDNLSSTLTKFGESFKTIDIKLIKHHQIQDWIESHDTWSSSSKKEVKAHISNFFNWLVWKELVDINPTKKVKQYKGRARGVECVIPEADWLKFISHTRDTFRSGCELIWHSGARPSEIRLLQIGEVDLHNMVIVKKKHKTLHKGHHRSILLTEEATQILRGVIGTRTTGGVFLSRTGREWTSQGWSDRWDRARTRAGLETTVIPYGVRHTFTVRMLRRGVPAHAVASMLGHSGTDTLFRHYGHLLQDQQSYRKWLE